MNIAEKSRNFLEKLQSLPEDYKKIILLVIVSILAVVMGYFWIKNVMNTVPKIVEESAKSMNSSAVESPSTNILQTTTPSNK